MREQITDLLRRGYEPPTFVELACGERPRRAFAVTFDDGYRSIHEQALPVLSELGVPATVFVPTAFVGCEEPMAWPGIEQWLHTPHKRELLPLDWDQLRELQARAGRSARTPAPTRG